MPIPLGEVGAAKLLAALLAIASGRSSTRLVPGRDALAGVDRFFLPLSHLRIPPSWHPLGYAGGDAIPLNPGCSLQSRQRRVQGTASNRAGEMGCLQVSHTPNT